MELANIAFHFEHSGRRTLLGKHLKKRNMKEKVGSLLDEKRGKRSILGRYLNDVIKHTEYTKHEKITERRSSVENGNRMHTGKENNIQVPNFDDYVDLAYCAETRSSPDTSFSDSDEIYVRGSGDGSETPDTEESSPIATVTRSKYLYRDRIVIGAEAYTQTSQQTVYIDNRDDFIERDIRNTGTQRQVETKRRKTVGFVLEDNIAVLEKDEDEIDTCMIKSSDDVLASRESRGLSTYCHTDTVAAMACYCGSDVMQTRETKVEPILDIQHGVTSLKRTLKQKTKSKLQILFNMYKSRKSQIKRSKIRSTPSTTKPVTNYTRVNSEHDSLWQNGSQTDDNIKRDSFNYAFCDEASRVAASRDQKLPISTGCRKYLVPAFIPMNIEGHLLNTDISSINSSTDHHERSCVTLCRNDNKCSDKNFVYFNDGFIM